MNNKVITEAKTTTSQNYLIEQKISRKIVVLEITGEETGYTIQSLKGIDYTFSDPAVIVKTYKVNILLRKIRNDGTIISDENKGYFNVTRDSWYYLGTQKQANKKIIHNDILLNREFIPDTYERNQYTAYWIPNFPRAQIQRVSRKFFDSDGLNAFKLTRFGSSELPAKPLRTDKTIDGKLIDEPRKISNIATEVLIHIGGTYSLLGYEWLGGSYGCFCFIPELNIYSTIEKAKLACIHDDYDDHISNSDWKKICDNILKISFPNKLKIEIHLKEKKGETYVPEEILEE
ncbi:hypothetical protein EDC44_1515 [Cricetibacter osteomyelitidis]|uniref:Uncharacterized protein n=1 Tax=Cricetibacter osteomyelitidis TaxID=1521931 RepID=A0A4R2SGA2_9PAST|nr:hypothetical protein [Cricetibacter osteomyelitidis]TCP88659.1 hypothetical protein EDC44_1515 [Cricetibacter osteomyelitidis]